MSEKNISNAKIAFDIVYAYDGATSRTILLESTDKNGRYSFIDKYGNRWDRPRQGGEEVASYDLNMTELNAEGKQRVYKRVEYFPASVEPSLSDSEKAENVVARQAHNFLKTHYLIVVRGENNTNVNPNATSMPLFELRETTKIVNAEVEKNMLITKARVQVTEMFTNDKKGFTDFCYRYGIRPVFGVPVENLFNEVSLKLSHNPSHFFKVLEHKDAKLLTAVKMGMIGTSEDKVLIELGEKYYTFNGELLGESDEEVINYFKNHPRERNMLYKELGISADDEVEVVELPAESDSIEHDSDKKRKTDAARLNEMKKGIDKVFTGWKLERKKDPTRLAAVDKQYQGYLDNMRENGGWDDMLDVFDARVAEQKKYIAK